MKILVISDLHLGTGKYFSGGHRNYLEDFEEDEHFFEFVGHYSSGEYETAPVTLVLNGDILNLIQIQEFGVFTHQITEQRTVRAVENIRKGHPRFFEGLRLFLSYPNKKIVVFIFLNPFFC